MESKKAGKQVEEPISPLEGEVDEWAVMFIDIEGSTRLKYQELEQEKDPNIPLQAKWRFSKIVTKLLHHIQRVRGGRDVKFTGDGAMLLFQDPQEVGCQRAVAGAESIIQYVDQMNLQFQGWPHPWPQIHVRIGIACGPCTNVNGVGATEVSGRPADLAARLCSEADRDGILVDCKTKEASESVYGERFKKCTRRLALKGVPLDDAPDSFWHFRVHRLIQSMEADYSSKGLIAVYLDRAAMDKDFPDVRSFIKMAAPDSSVFVAGRTLKSWAETLKPWAQEQEPSSDEIQVKFYFLLSSPESWNVLADEERFVLEKDYADAFPIFQKLSEVPNQRFHLEFTHHLILDGVTFARIKLPGGNPRDDARLMVLQDINVFQSGNAGRKVNREAEAKAALLWVCTCGKKNDTDGVSCTAHGLLRRTLQFWPEPDKPKLFD